MELDKETQKVLSEGEKIRDGINSDFWRIIRGKLTDLINSQDSLSAMEFEGKSTEQKALEAESRANTVATLKQWLADIEGTAETHDYNKNLTEDDKDSLIKIYK